MTDKTDLAASVAARLLKRTRATGGDFQTLLTSYCLERFLFRLGASDRRERFVLKGAMSTEPGQAQSEEVRLWSRSRDEGFQIGAHDAGDAASLRMTFEVVHREFLRAPCFAERL